MSRIQDYQAPPIRQRLRAGATGPLVRRRPEQMRARFRREIFYAIEIDDQKFCKARQSKRIERLTAGNPGEIPQAKSS